MNGHMYTDEEKQFLVDFSPGHSRKEITAAFNEKFGYDFGEKRISSAMHRYGATTGRTGCFEKGHEPHNKGKKMSQETYEKLKATMFKKGDIPIQYRPVGSERISKDGFVEIKTEDPNKWELKHRVVWEKTNGEIPKGHVVIFLDGNTRNFQLDNLMCITMAENLYLNRHGLRFNNKELTMAAVNVAKVARKTFERRNKKNEI